MISNCRICGKPFHRSASRLYYCSHPCYAQSLVRPWPERFWAFIEKGESCWHWKGSLGRRGYGLFSSRQLMPKTQAAHRIMWSLTYGAIPRGLNVLHKCDNPPCCNPTHLYTGTQADNMNDRKVRDRTAKGICTGAYTKPQQKRKGETHGNAKLTDAAAIELRSRYAKGEKPLQLAKEYGISYYTVWRIGTGRA